MYADGAEQFLTAGGITVARRRTPAVLADLDRLVDDIGRRRGLLLSSAVEVPGRYTRWDIGYVDPPLEFTAWGGRCEVRALNARGAVLLDPVAHVIDDALGPLAATGRTSDEAGWVIPGNPEVFAEEQRTRRLSVMTLVRAIRDLLATEADEHLGLYGMFGYDLVHQFEDVTRKLDRDPAQRDLVLHLPDRLLISDRATGLVTRCEYEFAVGSADTTGLERDTAPAPYLSRPATAKGRDHQPGEYAAMVEAARASFARGDLFEVVPGQTFWESCPAPPGDLFRRLLRRNPAPFGFLANLGEEEFLVGASPEMYVRVTGRRVETCPISGTIARGADAIEDSGQILTLLNSAKDEAELTMCTDVDRNDKARVCEPGSVRVIGRRQIEMYSRLIHTVDHVDGLLREDFDAIDAFLTHAWAVTVTGAPKPWALQFIEDHERSQRRWYGGAVGVVSANGDLNTGLVLRTIHVRDGVAYVRVGATLLHDSVPAAEERETELKASALFDALADSEPPSASSPAPALRLPPRAPDILLVDHQDSFVHTLADYFRQLGATVRTVRAGSTADTAEATPAGLVVLSPGPGRPADFAMGRRLAALAETAVPVLGVCLGMQGIVEFAGGSLRQLATPTHGVASLVRLRDSRLFAGLPDALTVGRYHSLVANRAMLPAELAVTAETDDGVVMAVEHATLPFTGVQFHPESILTGPADAGLQILANACRLAQPAPQR